MSRTSIVRLSAVLALTAAAGIAQAGPEHKKADATHAHAADVTPLSELVPFEQPELWVGSEAPALAIAEYVKGDSIHAFEEDRIYVVEFWATWCGPCIRAFPHLSEMQEKLADHVTFVGVNIWDTKNGESQASRIERVSEFVEEQGDRMGYTVAIEQDEKMAELWMEPANRSGIPSAFIVDGKGKVAWMGHPMNMDAALDAVVKGEHDYEETAESLKKDIQLMAAYQTFMEHIRSDDEASVKKAYKIADAFAFGPGSESAAIVNAMAWTMIDGTVAEEYRDYNAAYRIAKVAGEASEWNSASILDTVALAAFKVGERDRAIELQKKAISLLGPDEDRSEYEAHLEMFMGEG